MQNAPLGAFLQFFSTFIKLPFVIKIFVLSIFEWPFYSCFTVVESVNILNATAILTFRMQALSHTWLEPV